MTLVLWLRFWADGSTCTVQPLLGVRCGWAVRYNLSAGSRCAAVSLLSLLGGGGAWITLGLVAPTCLSVQSERQHVSV